MTSQPAPGDITRVLADLRAGDGSAMDRLMEMVYDDLRKRAHWQLRSSGGTLSTTALVHETYLRLAAASEPAWEDRYHFFNVAAKAMRQIVIDYARERAAQKRGGGAMRVELDDQMLAVESQAEELLTIDAALSKLELAEPRLAQVVELRFFAGLSVEEVGAALGVTSRTAKRDWRKARELLRGFLSNASASR